MQGGKKMAHCTCTGWCISLCTPSTAKTARDTHFSFHTMLVQSICNKNQSREKLKTKNILWRSSYKICSIFADFWAISCIFRPTKKFFETYFIILLHIQLQEAISNQSVKSASKNIEKWLRYRFSCKISLNQHNFGTVPNSGFWAIESTFLELLP